MFRHCRQMRKTFSGRSRDFFSFLLNLLDHLGDVTDVGKNVEWRVNIKCKPQTL
jgi:hypothetical protein